LSKQWQDLIDFEGNANGFSVLTASRPGIEGGLRILISRRFMKYPESLPKKPTNNISDKSTVSSKQIKSFLKKQQKTWD
jgi:dGTPase